MPGISFSMPLPDSPHPVVGCPVEGDIRAQRAAMAQLLAQAGWPTPRKEDSGRPRMANAHCSLSHGGGWAVAARHTRPIGVDVEAASDRLLKVAARFCAPADQPVLDHFGEGMETLCRLWTAKEAVFKAFGTSVDFLTGIRWTEVGDDTARLTAVQHTCDLELRWIRMPQSTAPAPVWLAVAVAETNA